MSSTVDPEWDVGLIRHHAEELLENIGDLNVAVSNGDTRQPSFTIDTLDILRKTGAALRELLARVDPWGPAE